MAMHRHIALPGGAGDRADSPPLHRRTLCPRPDTVGEAICAFASARTHTKKQTSPLGKTTTHNLSSGGGLSFWPSLLLKRYGRGIARAAISAKGEALAFFIWCSAFILSPTYLSSTKTYFCFSSRGGGVILAIPVIEYMRPRHRAAHCQRGW